MGVLLIIRVGVFHLCDRCVAAPVWSFMTDFQQLIVYFRFQSVGSSLSMSMTSKPTPISCSSRWSCATVCELLLLLLLVLVLVFLLLVVSRGGCGGKTTPASVVVACKRSQPLGVEMGRRRQGIGIFGMRPFDFHFLRRFDCGSNELVPLARPVFIHTYVKSK
jgi:hypothetical protein